MTTEIKGMGVRDNIIFELSMVTSPQKKITDHIKPDSHTAKAALLY
jgi:hypothetical protein